MQCVRCGAQIPDSDRFCSGCGTPVQIAAQPQQVPAPQPWPQPVQVAQPQALRYAGFWRRFAALLVDGLIVGLLWFVLSGLYDFVIASVFQGTAFAPDGAALERTLWLSSAGRWLLQALVIFLYFVLMESTTRGATPGKMLLGIRVARADGGRTGLGRSLIRTALKPVSALPLMFGYLIAAWSRRKQALHDLLSGSVVLRA